MDGGQSDAPLGDQPDVDPSQFNPKEIQVDKSVPWQKDSPPDNDGLGEAWEQQGNVDANADGTLDSSGGGEMGGGDGSVNVHDVHYSKSMDRNLNPTMQHNEQLGTDFHEQGHSGTMAHGSGAGDGKVEFNDFTVKDNATHVPKPGPKAEKGGGDEIYPDKYGRVKAQFHWDREGQKDDILAHELVHTIQQGPVPPPKDKGGGVLHEVGHWLGITDGGPNEGTRKIPWISLLVVIAIIAILVGLLGVNYIANNGTTNTETPVPTEPLFSDSQPVETEEVSLPTPTTSTAGGTTGGSSGGEACKCQGVDYICTNADGSVKSASYNATECGGSGECTCRDPNKTLACPDGTYADFNPQCGVGGDTGGGCKCVCAVGNPNCFDSCTGAICTPSP